MTLRRRLLAAALALAAGSAAAATLTLPPGASLQQLLRQAADGDTIEILAGDHRGQVAVIEHRRLTLRGVGGRPVLHADGRSAEGKAILVVRDGDIRIENLEFRGARVHDRNGAGIRFERGRLTVARCAFVDNENGILTANFGDAELTVQDSEFAQAPPNTPLPHLLYVGRIARFALSGSRFSGGRQGHLVKSRARVSDVRYNALIDGPGGQAAYELEFPNGGLAWVIGNLIGQSADTSNPVVLSFGSEGSDEREHGLFMAHNTVVSAGLRPAWFVRVAPLLRPVERRLVNNLYVGLGATDVAWDDVAQGNVLVPLPVLRDAARGDFGLAPETWLRGRAVEPGQARGLSLRPEAEFAAPVGTRSLAPPARWAPGALQE